jgi:hypothetical protein
MFFLRLFAAGMATYLLLALLGWFPWRLLVAGRKMLPFVVAAPLFGLAILSAFGWYWLEFGSGGMAVGLPVLVGISVVVSVVALVRLRGRVWVQAPSARGVASAALLALLVFAGLAFHYGSGADGGRLTAQALGNNDIASYSLIAQGLQHDGFDEPGPVVGSDLGEVARADSSAALTVLSSGSELTGLATYEATIPLIGLVSLLAALACASFAARIAPGSPVRSAAIGLAAVAPYLFVNSAGQYFLSQAMSVAPVVAMLIVYVNVAERRDRASFVFGAATIALLTLPVVLTYPHMALLPQPILLGVAWLADGFRDLARRAGRLVGCAVAGVAAAVLLVAPAAAGALERARDLGGVDAGWALGLLSPIQALGFQRFPSMIDLTQPGSTTWRFLFEAAALGVMLVAATVVMVRAQRSNAWLGALTVVAVLASYRLVFQTQGYSYRQWKWISFFQPVLSTALLAVVCAAAVVILHRFAVAPNIPRIVGTVVVAAWIAVLTWNAHTLTDDRWTVVGRDLTDLAAVADSELKVVNIAATPYWETMWAAYFVAPVRSRLVHESYYGTSDPTARWTVRSMQNVTGQPVPRQTVEERRINDDYELVCGRLPCRLRLG